MKLRVIGVLGLGLATGLSHGGNAYSVDTAVPPIKVAKLDCPIGEVSRRVRDKLRLALNLSGPGSSETDRARARNVLAEALRAPDGLPPSMKDVGRALLSELDQNLTLRDRLRDQAADEQQLSQKYRKAMNELTRTTAELAAAHDKIRELTSIEQDIERPTTKEVP
ncbi:MAG: hypothetical protein ACR2RB_11325 [Gammaproteobacteria bacterium]